MLENSREHRRSSPPVPRRGHEPETTGPAARHDRIPLGNLAEIEETFTAAARDVFGELQVAAARQRGQAQASTLDRALLVIAHPETAQSVGTLRELRGSGIAAPGAAADAERRRGLRRGPGGARAGGGFPGRGLRSRGPRRAACGALEPAAFGARAVAGAGRRGEQRRPRSRSRPTAATATMPPASDDGGREPDRDPRVARRPRSRRCCRPSSRCGRTGASRSTRWARRRAPRSAASRRSRSGWRRRRRA